MKLKPLPLETLVERIEGRKPFMLTRYGDGEWLGVLGMTPRPRWGPDEHEPDLPGLPEALRAALRVHPVGEGAYPCMVAMQVTKRMGLVEPVKRWLAQNARHTFGHWHDGREPFRDAAEAGKFAGFLEALAGQRTVMVGGAHLGPVADALGAGFVEIPEKNCWTAYDDTHEALLEMDWARGDVVTFSAAMMSEVIVPALWEKLGGEVTLIDAGSIFDPLCGAPSRSWHRKWMQEGVLWETADA